MSNPDTPPLTDLIGLAPDLTGGLSPEEYLRRQRCGKCDETLAELERLRTNAELLSCSTMGEAFDRLEELLAAERERDAARRDAEQARAELEQITGVAKALRITVAEMLSGKQHTQARTLVWESTLKYATEALTTPEASS